MTRADDRQAVIDQALYLAVNNGDEKNMRAYLAEGANPNTPVDGGKSAFGTALWLQMLDVAQEMLSYGADINFQRGEEGAPIWLTALLRDGMRQTTARTQFCIDHGANFAMTFKYGERMVTVLQALDEVATVLSEKERDGLRAVRRMVEAELALDTRARQQRLGAKRRSDNGRYKL